jgi:hypothetical protein
MWREYLLLIPLLGILMAAFPAMHSMILGRIPETRDSSTAGSTHSISRIRL